MQVIISDPDEIAVLIMALEEYKYQLQEYADPEFWAPYKKLAEQMLARLKGISP